VILLKTDFTTLCCTLFQEEVYWISYYPSQNAIISVNESLTEPDLYSSVSFIISSKPQIKSRLWYVLPKNHLTERFKTKVLLAEHHLTERLLNEKSFDRLVIEPNAVWPKNYFTRKVIWPKDFLPKGRLTEKIENGFLIENEIWVIWQKALFNKSFDRKLFLINYHLTERSFDRKSLCGRKVY
jgi:hypothetical protein